MKIGMMQFQNNKHRKVGIYKVFKLKSIRELMETNLRILSLGNV
jgi:hypothetical protein